MPDAGHVVVSILELSTVHGASMVTLLVYSPSMP